MEIQKPRIAFTSSAFVTALKEYDYHLFDLVKKYGKLFVSEHHLCINPEVKQTSIHCSWLLPLIQHWFDIQDPPPFGETDEITILAHLDKLYPDNIIIVVDKLEEYSRLNRVYSNDELYLVNDLYKLITNSEDKND